MASNNIEGEQLISSNSGNEIQLEPQYEKTQNVVGTITEPIPGPSNEDESSHKKDTGRIWLYILQYLAKCQQRGDLIPELPPMLLPFKKQFLDFLDYEERKNKLINENLTEEEKWCEDYIAQHANLPIEPDEEKIIIDDWTLNNNCDNEYERILVARASTESIDENDDDSDSNSLLLNTNIEVKRFHTFTCSRKSRYNYRSRARTNSKPKVRALLRFKKPRNDELDEI